MGIPFIPRAVLTSSMVGFSGKGVERGWGHLFHNLNIPMHFAVAMTVASGRNICMQHAVELTGSE